MSFSATFCPGIPPRSWPPCPASITTVIGVSPPPELRLLFAANRLVAKNIISRPATDKLMRLEFLCITGRRLWAARADDPKVLVLYYQSSEQARRPCRRARLPRRYPNERGGAAFWFP